MSERSNLVVGAGRATFICSGLRFSFRSLQLLAERTAGWGVLVVA